MSVLITVPHATCPYKFKERHLCDYIAPYIAKKLHNLIPNSKLILAEIHRDANQIAIDGKPGSDQNRPWGRQDTKFYQEFSKSLKEIKDQPLIIVLDIHSFPSGSFNEKKNTSVVILEPFNNYEISIDLYNTLIKNNINSEIIKGSTINFIIMEAREYGIPSILIEFNENFSHENTIKVISNFISNNNKIIKIL